jgi:hypothetical protein
MNLYFIGRGIVLKGIVKYYGSGKNIPRTFGHTGPHNGYSRPPLLETQPYCVKFARPLKGQLVDPSCLENQVGGAG